MISSQDASPPGAADCAREEGRVTEQQDDQPVEQAPAFVVRPPGRVGDMTREEIGAWVDTWVDEVVLPPEDDA